MARVKRNPWLKPLVFTLCLLPLAALLWATFTGNLGVNPVEQITHTTGDWALRLLLLTLAVTPARRFLGWRWPGALRRMLGLFAFFYACLHFATYLILDHSLSLAGVWEDIAERPYITVGFTALLLLIPLAITSTDGMVRRLGGKLWRQLHRLIYPIAILAVIHFLWLVKADLREPLIYALILALLLTARLVKQPARAK